MRKSLTYTNAEFGFSVDHPADWGVREDLVGVVVAFAGPSVLEGIYDVNINVNAERLLKEIALKDFAKASDLRAREAIPNYNKVREYSVTINGLPAVVSVATFVVKCNGEKVALKNKYAIVIKDKVAYTITYDAPVEYFDEYADCFDLVISSFK